MTLVAPSIARKSVLVVDDDADIRAALRDVLEEAGHQVIEAADGAEAFRVLTAGWLPSIVFLDKHMPGMDGDRFLEEVDAHFSFRELPVVIITGDKLRGGSRVYLRKPLSVEQVLEMVRVLAR